MTDERPTLDIARELRDVAKPGGFLADLLTEAADRLDQMHEALHQQDVQIAIREGERDRMRDELARAIQQRDTYRHTVVLMAQRHSDATPAQVRP